MGDLDGAGRELADHLNLGEDLLKSAAGSKAGIKLPSDDRNGGGFGELPGGGSSFWLSWCICNKLEAIQKTGGEDQNGGSSG